MKKKRTIARRLHALAHRVLPRNRWGNRWAGAIKFYSRHGRWPGPSMRFNDYVFRIKTDGTLDRPLQSFTTDKELAKLYVKALLGEAHVVPTFAVLRSAKEAREFAYPERCVIKPTHSSGRLIIRTAGEPVDLDMIAGWFHHDYYSKSRETNYRHLEPKVIVEELAFDNPAASDYKIFCVDGQARAIRIVLDRWADKKRAFYSTDWRLQAIFMNQPTYQGRIERPACLNAMLAGAEKLAQGFGFARIDCYCNGEHFYVGEITCCPESADSFFDPPEDEFTLTRLLFGDVV